MREEFVSWKNYQELSDKDGLRKLNDRLKFRVEDFKDASVLDLGCWKGQMTNQAKKWGAKEVLGIDYDVEAVKNSILEEHEIQRDDIDNPFFWRRIKKYDVVLALSIFGNLLDMTWGIARACQKTKKVLYVEGHGSYHDFTYEQWIDLFFNYTDFNNIEYLGETPDRPLFRLSYQEYTPEELVAKAGDRVAIIGRAGVGKTTLSKLFPHEKFSDPTSKPNFKTKKTLIDGHSAFYYGDFDTVILVCSKDEKERKRRIVEREYEDENIKNNAWDSLGYSRSSADYKIGRYNFYTITT